MSPSGHHIANEFTNMEMLKTILDEVVNETFTHRKFYALFRKRMDSPPYILNLMRAVIRKGHYVLALKAVMIMGDRLEPGRMRWRFRRHRKALKQAIATKGTYDLD